MAMRMIFEIHSLKNATPATVSRAGILFVNEVNLHNFQVVGENGVLFASDIAFTQSKGLVTTEHCQKRVFHGI